jgi:inorganic pyrophosphatase
MRQKRAGRKKVVLTDGQRARLENLWFVYGNHGPKATMENHGFIQGFLERDSDERDFYEPTPECLAAVDALRAGGS